ncbi:BTB/POZ domain-containing protein 6-like [Pecten maximus]|uniref:BTB/POZ domain-containing protein 6-like n=1 Tax=Pecten maximus TaxID=6579 RepID=UPI0014581B6F|nr:BTB/POZ domain-containing protein 6-like [Pecten maximus]
MATQENQSEQDWQIGKSLIQCLDYLFTSGLACDVTFLVGEEKEKISAHKSILLSRSPVFFAMLEGDLAEKGFITVPDISSQAFSMFLRYLYTDEIKLTVDVVTPVLSAARKYMVDHLVTKCETFLKNSLSIENACVLLEQAHTFTEENLIKDCLSFISSSADTVLQLSSFTDLCGACVMSITESDDLAEDESDVYEAVIRWSEAECRRQGLKETDTNRREVLGDILYTVRFPIMDHAYFRRNVVVTDILSANETRDIIRCHEDFARFSCKFNKNKRPLKQIRVQNKESEGEYIENYVQYQY